VEELGRKLNFGVSLGGRRGPWKNPCGEGNIVEKNGPKSVCRKESQPNAITGRLRDGKRETIGMSPAATVERQSDEIDNWRKTEPDKKERNAKNANRQ